MAACIIPVAPEFQDPVGSPNLPPELSLDMPTFGSIVSLPDPHQGKTFSFQAVDPNTSQSLSARWLVEYPPFVSGLSRVVQTDTPRQQPNNGSALPFSLPASCDLGTFAPGASNVHQLQVLVSDAKFLDSPPDQVETGGTIARQNWTVLVSCPSPTVSP